MERKLLISWYDGEGLLIQARGINGKGQMTRTFAVIITGTT